MLKRSSGAEHSAEVVKEGLSANPVRQCRSGECRHRHEVSSLKTGWGRLTDGGGGGRNQELSRVDWFHLTREICTLVERRILTKRGPAEKTSDARIDVTVPFGPSAGLHVMPVSGS